MEKDKPHSSSPVEFDLPKYSSEWQVNTQINELLVDLAVVLGGENNILSLVGYDSFQRARVRDINPKLYSEYDVFIYENANMKCARAIFKDGTYCNFNWFQVDPQGNIVLHFMYIPFSLEETSRRYQVGLEWFPDLPSVGIEACTLPISFWDAHQSNFYQIADTIYRRFLPNGKIEQGIQNHPRFFNWFVGEPEIVFNNNELTVERSRLGFKFKDVWRKLPDMIGTKDQWGDGSEQYVVFVRKPKNIDKGTKKTNPNPNSSLLPKLPTSAS